MKMIVVFMALLLTPFALAADRENIKPLSMAIFNDEQANVALSNQDMNRLFVVDDKITHVYAPLHRLIMHNDATGSIFINVLGESPFTVFITTQKERHFSVFVVPKSEPGVTVRLIPKTPVSLHAQRHSLRAISFERASSYEKTVMRLLRGVLLQTMPSGYVSIARRAFKDVAAFQIPRILKVQHHLSEQMVAGWLGDALAIRVLELTNFTSHRQKLSEKDFYQPGVRAVAIVQRTVLPHQHTFVYEVVSNV